MPPRPAVLKTDYPRRIVILSKRSEPRDLSSPAARVFTPLARPSSTFPPLSFQSLTTVKFSNHFVLITIRNAGGCTYPLSPSPSRKTEHPKKMRFLSERSKPKDLSLTPLISDPLSSTLVARIRVSQHPDLASGRRTRVRGSFSILSAVNCRSEVWPEIPARPELSATTSLLESTLTNHAQLIENTATLSSLESTLTRFRAVTPLEATLTRK